MPGFGDLKMAEAPSSRSFDKAKFGKYLRDNALPPFGAGKCAAYVRQALEAGGLTTGGHPLCAKDYGPFLQTRLFRVVTLTPEVGDIAVFQAVPRISTAGHIEGWDGRNWISDFIQDDIYPSRAYKAANASYAIYRRY